MRTLLLFLLSLCLVTVLKAAPMVMTPSVSPDGSHVAFSYQGDIWITSEQRDFARRMTICLLYTSDAADE